MSSDRWQQLSHLYHEALARQGADRAAFLAETCRDDEPLRRDVESLLAQPASALAFLDAPALAHAAQLVREVDASAAWVGRRLGAYQVQARLGAGGMGEVYRARDTKLGRDVAIKILPRAFTSDPERLARFEREARMLAALNHPNIGSIYGLEDAEGIRALVLELVEGETLADRITRGALSQKDALTIARQIADALEAAHDKGIVHRDLKPSNVALTREGTVKVLDFGLAKTSASSAAAADGSQAPTITIGATREGVVLGTASYMSPEQARGQAVDKRTDIWAFGCVLYEMLTGQTAFRGQTISDTIAAVLDREPDWLALPAATPPALWRMLRRCLDKDPRRRLRDIGDVRVELDDEGIAAAATPSAPTPDVPWKTLAAGVLLLFLVSAGGAAWWSGRRAPAPRRPAQFTFTAPEGTQLDVGAPVPSPDGARIVFAAHSASGQSSLWMRALNSTAARPVEGTENVSGPPFWSPDGRWIGFFAGGRLKKVDPAGGPALNICTIENNLGATWSRDNVIVLAPVNRTVLHRVSAAGGTPEPITTLNAERRENSHRWPHFLPDGRHFLFTARSDVKENNMIYVGSLDSREVMPLFAAQSEAVYAAPGYILYAQEGTVMARAFDPATLSVSGDAVPIAANVSHSTPSSNASFSASTDGATLAYLADVTRSRTLSWFDRAGKPSGTVGPERDYTYDPRLSPDGKSAGVIIPDPDSGNRDIWLVDLSLGTLSRFTSHPANDWQMAWSPDGQRIAFASDRNGRSSVYVKPVDGGEEELLLRLPDRGAFPQDFSRDGKFLTLGVDTPDGIAGVWAMPLVGERTPFSLSNNATVRENVARLSGDGRWLAFESRASGADEIYVARFPKGDRRVSIGGGVRPRWKADGRELYYLAENGDIMAAAVVGTEPIQPAVPVRLFRACGRPGASLGYDVTADGSRFLMVCGLPSTDPSAVTVSMDWAASVQ